MGILNKGDAPSPRDPPSSPTGAAGPLSQRTRERRLSRENQALGFCALIAMVAVAWLTLPVAAGLLLGALMGFTLKPLYEAAERRTGRPLLSSIATVLGSALAIIATVTGFASFFITRGVALTSSLLGSLGPGGALEGTVKSATHLLSRVGLSVGSLQHSLRDAASSIAGTSAAVAQVVAEATASGLLGLFFALLSMHLILRNWESVISQLEVLSPLRPQYTRALLEEFQRVGRATLLGTVVTGIAQGVLATVGFSLTSAPEPVFFGIATALASLIPGVGTLLVWAPIGIYQLATGHPARGVIELVWGIVMVVGVSEYVVRPRLVGDEAVPTLVTFIALFGGVQVFGLKGLVVGPVVMSLAVATLRLYARESAAMYGR